MYGLRTIKHQGAHAGWAVLAAFCLGIQFNADRQLAMAATPNPGEMISPELEEFIFHPDQFKTEDVPRGLQPAVITKFVEIRIGPLTPLAPVKQMEKVVEWYDVLEVCDHLTKLLDRHETTPETFERSAVICRILARLGDASQRDLARQYANTFLTPRAETVPVLTDLVSLQEALGGEEPPTELQQHIDARLTLAQATAATDPQARQQAQALERLKNVSLPRTRQVNAIKTRVLQLANRPERLLEEAKIYLGIKYGYGEYLPAWAAARLRRECWADQPAEQNQRKISPARQLQVVSALRAAIPYISGVPQITDAEKDIIRVTALKAVQYFGGQITDDEAMFLASKGHSIDTILSL